MIHPVSEAIRKQNRPADNTHSLSDRAGRSSQWPLVLVLDLDRTAEPEMPV
jgi:hypothetical protein